MAQTSWSDRLWGAKAGALKVLKSYFKKCCVLKYFNNSLVFISTFSPWVCATRIPEAKGSSFCSEGTIRSVLTFSSLLNEYSCKCVLTESHCITGFFAVANLGFLSGLIRNGVCFTPTSQHFSLFNWEARDYDGLYSSRNNGNSNWNTSMSFTYLTDVTADSLSSPHPHEMIFFSIIILQGSESFASFPSSLPAIWSLIPRT